MQGRVRSVGGSIGRPRAAIVVALVLVGAMLNISEGAEASAHSPPSIRLYDGENFTGDSKAYVGSSPQVIPEDTASSIEISPGISAAVYVNRSMGYGLGPCLTVTSNLATLPPEFNDSISSIRLNGSCQQSGVAPTAGIPWVRLTDASLAIYLTASRDWLALDMFSNVADTVTVSPGTTAIVYSQSDYRGACARVPGGTSLNLASVGLRDAVVSVHLGEGTCTMPPAVVLHSDANFGGIKKVLTSDAPDLRGPGGFEGLTSSVELIGVKAAAIYEGGNYATDAPCQTLLAHESFLGDNDWVDNDRVTSVKLNATCTGPLTGDPYIRDMKIVTNRLCPSGWETKAPVTLTPENFAYSRYGFNVSVEGYPVFLCIRWGSAGDNGRGYSSVRTDVIWNNALVKKEDLPAPCRELGEEQIRSDDHEYDPLEGDLNAGSPRTSGVFGVFLCAIRAQNSSASNPLRDIRFVTNVGSGPRAGLTKAQIRSRCNDAYPGTAGVTADTEDLNSGVHEFSGSYTAIFSCYLYQPAAWSSSSSGYYLDSTPPVIELLSRSEATSHGWNGNPVTVTWRCSDDWSGPLQAVVSELLDAEGRDQQATGECVDLAGNSSTHTVSAISIDLTPPDAPAVGSSIASHTLGMPLRGTATDGLAGVVHVEVRFKDATGNEIVREAVCSPCGQEALWTVSTAALVPGVYEVVATAFDAAANLKDGPPATVIVL